MQGFLQDVSYGLRQLRKSPGLTCAAVLTLALGTGANALMFTVIDSVLLRPMPYPNADRLVALETARSDVRSQVASLPDFEDWRAQSKSFSGMAAYDPESVSMQVPSGEPLHVAAVAATANLFDVLGVRPILGRTFFADEDQPGKPCVAVVREDFWREHLAGDRTALGSNVALDGRCCTIVGVMPAGFTFPSKDEAIWTPLHPPAVVIRRGTDFLSVIGRLKPGVTLASARSELTVIGKRLAMTYMEDKNTSIGAQPYRQTVTGDARPALLALLAAVAALLLITCSNVANLQLARAIGRRREIAIRAALGCGRGRMARQLFTENAILALAATGAGLFLAYLSLDVLKRLAAGALPRVTEIELRPEVCAAMLGVAGLTALLFGLAPVLQMARLDIEKTLRENALATGATRGSRRTRDLLVVGQLSLAIVLLAGSGLLLRTLDRMLREDRGFTTERILTLQSSVSGSTYEGRDLAAAVYAPELDQIRVIPGVQSAGFVTYLPLSPNGHTNVGFQIIGRPNLDPQKRPPLASLNAVSGDYFRTLGIALLKGRFIDNRDTLARPKVAVINETFARKYFPTEDVIGKQIAFMDVESLAHPMKIVGVVRGSRETTLAEPPDPEIYLSFQQIPPDTLWSNFLLKDIMAFVIRTKGDPSTVSRDIQAAIHDVDPTQSIFDVASMEEVVSESVHSRQLGLILLAVFAGLALVVASAGLYAVLSYTVGQRTRDIAVRMALGAKRADVVGNIVSRALLLYAAAWGIGVLGAVWCGHLLSSMLSGVRPWDPIALLAASGALILATVASAWIPARRAASIDPSRALRAE